jgi:epoxyqueuosine reductase
MSSNLQFLADLDRLSSKAGLNFLGPVSLDVQIDYQRYEKWINAKLHADMKFMESNTTLRSDPRLLAPTSNCALVFALNYDQGDRFQPNVQERSKAQPRIAMYARLKDYHRYLKREIHKVLVEASQSLATPLEFRLVVDSAPVLERALAKKTPRSFIGKNTCLIHLDFGSFLLLGSALVCLPTIDLESPDASQGSRAPLSLARSSTLGGCGSCRRCQVMCPTNALSKDYVLDANRCLSYWTIENRGPIPEEYWPHLAEYFFGCDICQTVCPYNRPRDKDVTKDFLRLKPNNLPTPVDLFKVATMNQQEYEFLFGGTPLTRAKRSGLIRNALIALFSRNDERLELALLTHDNSTDQTILLTTKAIRSKLSSRSHF